MPMHSGTKTPKGEEKNTKSETKTHQTKQNQFISQPSKLRQAEVQFYTDKLSVRALPIKAFTFLLNY